MIRFREDVSLTIIDEFVEGNIGSELEQMFGKGEFVDASIRNNDGGDYVDIEFGDGRRALGVQRECIEVVERKTR